jgi:glycosyltransferase involved in cell wall biosynthesis
MTEPVKKVAILFRYGAGEHIDFLPALPDLVCALNEQGVEVHHFGFRSKLKVPEYLKKQMNVHAGPFRVKRSGKWDKWIKATLWILYLPFLGKRLQKEGFDRVFVDETLPLSCSVLRMTYKGWLSFTVHDFFVEIYLMPHSPLRPLGKLLQRLDVRAWKTLNRIFVRVDAAKRAVTEMGMDPDHISVVPDAVDLDLFHANLHAEERSRIRKSHGLTDKDVIMVHHGILHPNKGNGLLVHAMFRARHRYPNLKLLILGDGPERAEIERIKGTRGIDDRVILTGWLPQLIDISELLRASDIGLVMRKGLPGDHYHVTSTLVHNAAVGLPLLAARLDGISEGIEEGTQGYLFDPECGSEFDAKLDQLMKDVEKRKKMGGNARILAEERFNPKQIALQYARDILS